MSPSKSFGGGGGKKRECFFIKGPFFLGQTKKWVLRHGGLQSGVGTTREPLNGGLGINHQIIGGFMCSEMGGEPITFNQIG